MGSSLTYIGHCRKMLTTLDIEKNVALKLIENVGMDVVGLK